MRNLFKVKGLADLCEKIGEAFKNRHLQHVLQSNRFMHISLGDLLKLQAIQDHLNKKD